MFGNIKRSIAGCKAAVLLMAGFTLGLASVPAPPVNQTIGIPDSVFNNLEKQNCWYCHIPERLSAAERDTIGWTFQAPTVKDGVITDRHHARVGTPIQEHTQAPFDAVAGQPYECLNCHQIAYNPAIGANEVVQNFVNCLNCHTQMSGEASVHHLTAPAQALNCQHCHGSRIDNPGDGHYIPIGRVPSSVTPRTSAGKGPNGEGACTFCHNSGIDTASGIEIFENSINHHSTGIGQDGVSGLDCTVCHENAGTDTAIRRCEDCHGINSIHSIQADSNGDGTIVVGAEEAYFGHIGNQSDCIGCHGGYLASSSGAPSSDAVVPSLIDMSTFRVTAGSATTITVTGLALTNEVPTPDGNVELTSLIALTNINGSDTELTPNIISASVLEVTIPADLVSGSYYLRAVKGTNASNPMSLIIMPRVAVNTLNVTGGTLTIGGTGFGKYLNALNSGTGVTVASSVCAVESWTDTQIVANCGTAQCGQLVVEGIYGKATGNIVCSEIRTRESRRSRGTRR